MGDKAARTRARILDAAAQCLTAGGLGSARLHTAIASLAGLSRPTVYKHVGDQDAIMEALVQREVTVFIDELRPVLEQRQPRGEQIVNILVFVVEYAREHPLLQAVANGMPEKLLPWFTTHAAAIIEQVEPVVRPYFRQYVDDGELPDIDPRLLVDALGRMALSLIFTSGILDLSSPDALRNYVITVARAVGQSHSHGRSGNASLTQPHPASGSSKTVREAVAARNRPPLR